MSSTQSNRVIFQNSNLFVAPVAQSGSTATGAFYSSGNSGVSFIGELNRIQSIDLSSTLNRFDVNVFGRAQRIDSEIISPPTFTLNFSYYVTDGQNENILGFNAKGITSFVSGMLTKTSDSKNYFISYSPPGVDDDGYTPPANRDVAALGNGFVSNWSINAAVNQPVTASVTVEGLNVEFFSSASGQQTPAIDPATAVRLNNWTWQLPTADPYTGVNTISILKPGDLSLSFPNGAGFGSFISGAYGANIQSFSLSVPISRTKIERLGSPFGISDEINLPVTATLSIQGLQTNIQSGGFTELLCNDVPYNMQILMRQPSCNGTGATAIILQANQCFITSHSIRQTIGGAATVDLTYNTQISNPANAGEGIIISGYF